MRTIQRKNSRLSIDESNALCHEIKSLKKSASKNMKLFSKQKVAVLKMSVIAENNQTFQNNLKDGETTYKKILHENKQLKAKLNIDNLAKGGRRDDTMQIETNSLDNSKRKKKEPDVLSNDSSESAPRVRVRYLPARTTSPADFKI